MGIKFLIFGILFLLVFTPIINATIVTLVNNVSENMDDGYIDQQQPTTNLESIDGTLRVSNSSGADSHVLIRFNKSSISGIISSATLRLYLVDNNLEAGESFNISIHDLYNNYEWNETGITWNNRPTIGTNYNATYSDTKFFDNNTPLTWVDFDVTSIIKTQINSENVSFYLLGYNQVLVDPITDDIVFCSAEYPIPCDSTMRPILNVSFNENSPTINITYPESITYDSSVTSLNYTISNLSALDTCWYTTNLGVTNTTIPCGNNITGLNSGEGTFNWYVYANNSLGNTGYGLRTFTVAYEPPTTSLDYPTNNLFFNTGTNIDFNFTAIDPNGIGQCELWGNWTGVWSKNQTITGITSGVQVNTKKNITDGTYIWNVNCSDSIGISQFNNTNLTFIIDTIKPNIPLSNISINITTGSQTVSFNVTGFTELHCNSAWYSVYDSTGAIENSIENISLSSCTYLNHSFTVNDLPPSTYNLTVYMNDSAGNLNSTTKSFTTTVSSTSPSSGGGGSFSTTTVICLKEVMNYSLNSLDRCKIYARLREYCINSSSLDNCRLSSEMVFSLLNVLKLQEVNFIMEQLDLNSETFDIYLEQFNNKEVEEQTVSELDANQYNLFKATLQVLESPLQVTPPKLDTFFLVTSKDSVFEYKIKSNKVIANAEIVDGELGLNVEKLTDTTALVKYQVQTLDFSARTVKGTVNYVTEDGESVFQEINIRMIYIFSPSILFGVLAVGTLGIFTFKYRKKLKRKFKIK